jgi:hypothetical protein
MQMVVNIVASDNMDHFNYPYDVILNQSMFDHKRKKIGLNFKQ